MPFNGSSRTVLKCFWPLPLLGLLSFQCTGNLTGAERLDESQIKAAFLFNLAKFVEWPPETLSSPADHLVTCVLGKGRIEEVLRQAIDRKVEGHPFAIRHISDAQEAGGCHILFVNQSVGRRWLSLERIKTLGILTVGESEDFISQGGAVNFKSNEDTIGIQVSVEAAVRAKVTLSSRLLALAEILSAKSR